MATVGNLVANLTLNKRGFTRGTQSAGKSLGTFVASATKQLGALAAAYGGLRSVMSLGRSAEGFEQALTNSLAIMGDVTEEQQTRMRQQAFATARSLKGSAKKGAEAYFFLASAGLDAEQSIAALPATAAFAQAGTFDLAKATDLATDAQSALGRTVSDAEKNLENMTSVTDVFAKANTLANATIQQFAESITNKGGAALRQVNKDLEEGTAVIAAWADQGFAKGEAAGTALNIVLRDLSTKAIKNRAEFDKLGVTVFDAQGNMANMADIIGDLEDAVGHLSPEMAKAALLQLGFADKSIINIQSLLGMSEKIRGYERDLRSAGGMTKEIADKQMTPFAKTVNTLSAAWEQFSVGTALQNSLIVPIRIATGLLDGMRTGLRRLRDSQAFVELSAAASEFLALARVAATELLAPFAGLADIGRDAGSTILNVATSIREFIQENREAIVTALKWGGAIAAALGVVVGLSAALAGVSAVLSVIAAIGGLVFSPIVAGVAAAVAAIVLLIGEGDTMGAMLTSAVAKVAAGFQTAWTMVKQFGATFSAVFGAARELAASVWSAITSFASDSMGSVGGSVSETMQNVADWILDALIVAEFGFRNAGDVAALWGSQVALAVTTMTNQITHFFTGVMPALFGWFTDNWTGIWTTVLDFTRTALINLGQNIRNIFGEIWDFIRSGGKGGFDVSGMWTPLTEGARSALSELPEIPARELGAMEKELMANVDRLKASLGTGLADFLTQRRGELQIDIAGEAARTTGDAARTADDAAKRGDAAGGVKPPPAGDDAQNSEAKFAAAVDVRSQEGFKAIQEAIGGAGQDTGLKDAAKKTAATTKQTAEHTKAMLAEMKLQRRRLERTKRLAIEEL